MLSIADIKNTYPANLHMFDKELLREYLQHIILDFVYEHKLSSKLIFIGGTCLRIVYGSQRFSEDIDFDNKGLTFSEFEELMNHVGDRLKKEGFEVAMKQLRKGAYHCYIKFPHVLYEQGLSPLLDEQILIQIDTMDQEVNYESEKYILDGFEVFKQISVVPKDILLSQKLITILKRQRSKGRDFYDVMYLLQSTSPNEAFLKDKLSVKNTREAINKVLDHVENINMSEMVRDVSPFLLKKEDAERLMKFSEYLKQKFETRPI